MIEAHTTVSRRFVPPAGCLPVTLACFVAGMLSEPARSAESPGAWLDRMAYAVEYLNYEGTLVHVSGGQADVTRIVHRVDDGKVSERVVALDGAGREIIRDDGDTTCILPDQQAVLVERRSGNSAEANLLRQRFNVRTQFDAQWYHTSIGGTDRLAERPAREIVIRPLDTYRYGYRVWLDVATAMPLKIQLTDEAGAVAEEIMFASIELPERIAAEAVRHAPLPSSFTWRLAEQHESPADTTEDPMWTTDTLPPGFRLVRAEQKSDEDSRVPFRHLVFSDGAAVVSIFIETGVAASEQAEGLVRIGAANAYMTTHAGFMVTAVGEVPARTAEAIARAIRQRSADEPAS